MNIPVLPTVSAKVTFTDFQWAEPGQAGLEPERFKVLLALPHRLHYYHCTVQVPESYTMDPYRFPDL